MNKQNGGKTRYYVQWDTHARHMCTILCSLMEHQSLVDLAICCGTNTIHAHKCVLAANSPYFREQLEKNSGTEQIVICGLDFSIVKSIIEFMYCGETNILDENLKYMIAAARFFQMRGLQTLVSDHHDIRYDADAIHITPPLFLPKKPKYPSAYRPLNSIAAPTGLNSFKPQIQNDSYFHKKIKRKFVRSEAEKACAKEAAASRLALEALQKELAATQMSSFVIEESCTETTVENFIPHTEETFIENINQMAGVPLQVVNFDELNGSILSAGQVINIEKPECSNATMQFSLQGNSSKNKLKRILGSNNLPGNIEIMYRTNDGNFVNVTTDVFQNISADGLQYQIVDEHGQIRELREFQTEDHIADQTSFETDQTLPLDNTLSQHCINHSNIVEDENEKYTPCTDLDIIDANNLIQDNDSSVTDSKTEDVESHFTQSSIDNSFSQIVPGTSKEEEIHIEENEPVYISRSINSSPRETCNTTVSDATLYKDSTTVTVEDDLYEETSMDIEENSTFNNYSMNEFLNASEVVEENNNQVDAGNNSDPFFSASTSNYKSDENSFIWTDTTKLEDNFKQEQETNVSASTNLQNENVLNSSVFYDEDGSGDCKMDLKRIKLDQVRNSMPDYKTLSADYEIVQLDSQHFEESYSPRKTRSTYKTGDNSFYLNNSTECFVGINSRTSSIKYDKPRRIMPNRKKKF